MPRTWFGPHGTNNETYANGGNANLGILELGSYLVLPDGRKYRFALNDGTVEVAGNLYQSVVGLATHTNVVCDTTRAIGATAISATLGTTLAAVDIYAEGIVHSNDATGEAYTHSIQRAFNAGDANAAAASSAVLTVSLAPQETVQVALDTTSEVTFTRNRYHQVLIHPAPPTSGVAGVSPGVAAADRFYWSQVEGYATCLVDGTLLEGLPAQASVTTAGAVESHKRRVEVGGTTAALVTTATTFVLLDQDGGTTSFRAAGLATTGTVVDITSGIANNAPVIGMTVKANASTEYGLINLTGLGS